MKIDQKILFTVAFLCSRLCSCLPRDEETMNEWESYKKTYKKSYEGLEDSHRMKVYMKHKGLIEKHNELFREGKVKFSLRINHLADVEQHELFPPELKPQESNPYHETVNVSRVMTSQLGDDSVVDSSLDWRGQGAVSEVKQQGARCGSCWAFSAVAALESQYFLKTGKMERFSEQYMVDCSKENNGCKGGHFFWAFNFCHDNGIVYEKDYPYIEQDGPCRSVKPSRKIRVIRLNIVPSDDEEGLKNAIARYGPATVETDSSGYTFQFYGGGIYQNDSCDPTSPNHGMLAVGYGRENGQDYWIVKNSFGKDWGENGYMKILRNRDNHCGIANFGIVPSIETYDTPDDDDGSTANLPTFLTLVLSSITWIFII